MYLQLSLIFKLLLIPTLQRTLRTPPITLTEPKMPLLTLILKRFSTLTAIKRYFIQLTLQISVQILIWSFVKRSPAHRTLIRLHLTDTLIAENLLTLHALFRLHHHKEANHALKLFHLAVILLKLNPRWLPQSGLILL